jgi:polyhydroxyalkanoate synthesis regulator phasin
MTSQSKLRKAFENVAGHIANLELVQSLVKEALAEEATLDDTIRFLRERTQEAEVTIQTDIRILINEIEHLRREKSSS